MWKLTLSGDGRSTGIRFNPWLFRGGFFLTGIATLMVIAAVTHQRAMMGRLLGNPAFNWVGTRSYGLYVYHWPIYQIIRGHAGVGMTMSEWVIAMAITVPIAEASYRYIEMPIRQGRFGEWLRGDRRPRTLTAYKRRQRFAGVGIASAALVGFAGVSIAMAEQPVCRSDRMRQRGRPCRRLATVPDADPVDRAIRRRRTTIRNAGHGPAASIAVQSTIPPSTSSADDRADRQAVLRRRRVSDARCQAGARCPRHHHRRRGVEGSRLGACNSSDWRRRSIESRTAWSSNSVPTGQ